MRQKNKRKLFAKLNLLFVGIGFILILGLIIPALNYKLIDSNRHNYTELKNYFPLIEDQNIYNFMNQLIKNNPIDSLHYRKMRCFTISLDEDSKKVINKISEKYLNKEDKKFILSQISNKRFLWDKNRLSNYWLLSQVVIDSLHNEKEDFWKAFKKEYGFYGLHSFSKPLFNNNKDIVVIEHSGSGGGTLGSGSILIYKKVDNSWVLIENYRLWIS